MKNATVCIVDDDPKIIYAAGIVLESDGYNLVSCSSGRECLELLERTPVDLVFLDIRMPDISGLDVLREIRKRSIDVPVIVITGFGTMDTAIEAVQLGAFEYLTKPLDMDKIRSLAKRALEVRAMNKESGGLKVALEGNNEKSEAIVGASPEMQEVFKRIGAVSATPNITPVLIEGESGTGKELVARAIHDNSAGSGGPFVAVNCTALPENLLESELFGHERGSYTGAHERRVGKLEQAARGTVFFDEIGDMSLELQQKLLRVLQERAFERVGSNVTMEVDARFVFATNRSLEREVTEGRFREDLWFRINVISIPLPPLRDRKDDIPLLVSHFVDKFNHELSKAITVIPDDVMDLLMNYAYPGNVRELGNLIEHGMILCKGNVLNYESLPRLRGIDNETTPPKMPIVGLNLKEAKRHVIDIFEKQYLTTLMKAHRGDVATAAKAAGIERQSLYRLLQKHGFDAGQFSDESGHR